MCSVSAAIEEYKSFVVPISDAINSTNLIHTPIFEQTRAFDTLNINNIISGLQTSASAMRAIMELNFTRIECMISALSKCEFSSDLITDDFSADIAGNLYESGKITQDDINEEITEIVSKKQFSPKAEWDKIKKSKWFIAIKILIIIATFVSKPVTDYAVDKVIENLDIIEFWEGLGVFDLINSMFGDIEEYPFYEVNNISTVNEKI